MIYIILSFGFLVIYVYVGYPIILLILALLKKQKIEKNDNYHPRVSLIISIYNEENVIEEKILNSLELDYPKDLLEIIVSSDSTDRTNEIVKGYMSKGVKLVTFHVREGKAAALFKIVPNVKGEIIVFSDANAIYDRMAIRKLVSNFYDTRVGCVSGMMRYQNPEDSNSGMGENAYWNFENFLKKYSSGFVTGSIFALRKSAYFPIDEYRGDDFELSMRAAINGYLVTFEENAHSFERVYPETKLEFKRKVRVVSWNLVSTLYLLKEAWVKKRYFIFYRLISHKLLRWFVPLFLLIILFCNFMYLIFKPYSPLLTLFFIFQTTFYSLAFTGYIGDELLKRKLIKLFWIPYYFCVINYAALVGIIKVISQRTEILWEVKR